MIKRIGLFLVVSLLILCVTSVSVYFINPLGVKTENIRPRLFGFDIYRIPSKSMQPLLFPGDYISVSNTDYLDSMPQRNDVIVFYKSGVENSKARVPYIKRVIAIGDDTVQIKNSKVWVNDIQLDEAYVLDENIKTPYSQEMQLITVPKNHVFLLGDNRDNSSDSRIYGSIFKDNIVAKASSIIFGIQGRSGSDLK